MKGLFPGFRNVTLDTYQPQDASQEEALRVIKDYIDHLADCRKGGTGLTIIGPPGVGKTHLAEAVIKHAQEVPRLVYTKGYEEPLVTGQKYFAESVTASEYVRMHQDMRDDEDVLDRVRRIERSLDFVLFDDLGREYDSGSGFASSVMFNTIKGRYNRRKPFIITSNMSVEKLVERYTGGFVSVLYGCTQIIQIDGEDYRAPGAARN